MMSSWCHITTDYFKIDCNYSVYLKTGHWTIIWSSFDHHLMIIRYLFQVKTNYWLLFVIDYWIISKYSMMIWFNYLICSILRPLSLALLTVHNNNFARWARKILCRRLNKQRGAAVILTRCPQGHSRSSPVVWLYQLPQLASGALAQPPEREPC